ncbi:hypothetical protein LB545_01290 [Mesorhizobium sp. BR1-1-6]|uniref:MvdC/MvdD family ATP grasp protein n=1 Tax=Mesorhizobium sp. BR1-1-6 TaxID=2876648 RepID=UPI001CD0FFBD|nr:hypothetical protein [Mesorhizobium sp. BR1-1-6]MBZ9892959.1 hypothetical protein [Mesorhizobium sp. BR1-1-6]
MDCLIVTNQRDITSDYIVQELKRRGRSFFRLNTEALATSELVFCLQDDSFDLRLGGSEVRLSDVRSAYFRRPEIPSSTSSLEDGYREYRTNEWLSALKSVYLYLSDRWFSHPSAILMAEDKPRQLRLAKSLGFAVPQTLVSNSFAEVRRFTMGKTVVGKPLRQALVSPFGAEQVIYTTRLPEIAEPDRQGIGAVPAIYQTEIAKRRDLRVTVVGERVFAVAIDSQSTSETVTDWRRGSVPGLAHMLVELPPDIEGLCVRIVQQLDLRFGAIDLILDAEGRHWFLECNPNGQWAWIENRTGAPISSAIVDELERIGRR